MTRDDSRPKLKEGFTAIRRADRHETPSFDRVWRSAEDRLIERRRPLQRWAPVAVGVAVLVVSAAYLSLSPFLSRPVDTVSLSEWRAPTDVFLDVPGIEWLGSAPRLESEIPNLTWETRERTSNPSTSRRYRS